MSKLERISSPYVRQSVIVSSQADLKRAVTQHIITNLDLASALRQGVALRRRFLLRPGVKDW